MTSSPFYAIYLGAAGFSSVELTDNEAFKTSARKTTTSLAELLALNENDTLDLFDSDLDVTGHYDQIKTFVSTRIPVASSAVLVIYYVGHGDFTAEGDFYLALRSTREGSLKRSTGFSATLFKDLLKERARDLRTLCIFDCCFSAAALASLQANSPVEAMKRQIHVDESPGLVLLASSGKDMPSFAHPDGRYTYFSEALVQVLEAGDPDGAKHLSMAALHRLVVARLPSVGGSVRPELHAPVQGRGVISEVPLIPNRGFTPTTSPSDESSKAAPVKPSSGLQEVAPEAIEGLLAGLRREVERQITEDLQSHGVRVAYERAFETDAAPSSYEKAGELELSLIRYLKRALAMLERTLHSSPPSHRPRFLRVLEYWLDERDVVTDDLGVVGRLDDAYITIRIHLASSREVPSLLGAHDEATLRTETQMVRRLLDEPYGSLADAHVEDILASDDSPRQANP